MVDNYQTETLRAATFDEGDASPTQSNFFCIRVVSLWSELSESANTKENKHRRGGNARIKQGKECVPNLLSNTTSSCTSLSLVGYVTHLLPTKLAFMFSMKRSEISSLQFGFVSRILDGKYQTPHFPCSNILFFNEVIDIPFLMG